MNKKVFFAVLMLAMGYAPRVWAYDFTVNTSGGIPLNYTVNSDGTTVTLSGHGTPCSGDLVIPATVTYGMTTYAVTAIGDYALRDCNSLTSVTLSEGITSIGYMAFFDCGSLTTVRIPNSVSSIGGGAFRSTDIDSVFVGSGLVSLGGGCFTTVRYLYYNSDGFSFRVGSSYTLAARDSLLTLVIGDAVTGIPRYSLPAIII